MKGFIRLMIAAQLLFFSSAAIFFSQQNRSSTSINPASREEYLEYFNQGEKLRLQGHYEESIKLFSKALSIARKNSNQKNQVESLIKLGLLHWNEGQLDRSSQFYSEALSLGEKTGTIENKNKEQIIHSIQIYHLYQDGKNYRLHGDHQKSIESFEQAIDLARKIKSEEHEVKCLRQLSVTHWEFSDINKFFSLNKKAQKIAQKLNHKKEEGRCLYNIGLYYSRIDNYSQALRHYQEALRIARILEDHRDESYCLTNISDVYIQVGNYEEALEYLKKVLKIDQALKEHAYIAMDLNNIGVIHRNKALDSDNKEDLYNALDYFKQGLEFARRIKIEKTEIQTLNNIGTIYVDLRNYPEALKHFELALQKAEGSQDIEETANILVNIGIVHSQQKNYDSSFTYFQRAIDTASSIKAEKILWEAYFEIAKAHMNKNDYQASLENYKKSIAAIENIRSKIQLEELKATYLGSNKRIDVYRDIIDLLYKLYQSEHQELYKIQAFNYLERAKARAFLDRLELSQVNISQGINVGLLRQENRLMMEISKLNSELLKPGLSSEQEMNINDQLKLYEERLEALKREIRISSPAYANLKYPKIISLEQAQKKLLDNKTAFFEYCIGEKISYAFVITRKKMKIFPVPSAKKIQTRVREYLQAITDKENHDFHLGYELFQTLILPGLEKKIEKLVFIPDGILHYLPFETLKRQRNGRKWLIEDYKIAYAPSISSLREIIERGRSTHLKPKKDILIFGDPFFGPNEEEGMKVDALKNFSSADTFSLLRLKHSGLEVGKVAALFKKAKTNIFKRKEATEAQLKKLNLTDYKILHFATHSLIDNRKPARSSIVFSLKNDSIQDGFLQMREIFNLKLNSDLVVLSACQTGLGQFIEGEGIENLSRAFFYAGASSALISLWAVHDQATAQFMERLYFHLRSPRSIMGSLQKTKLEMIDSDAVSHPYYWAGFTATGKSDRIIYPSSRKVLIFIIFLLFLGGFISSLIIFRQKFQRRGAVSQK